MGATLFQPNRQPELAGGPLAVAAPPPASSASTGQPGGSPAPVAAAVVPASTWANIEETTQDEAAPETPSKRLTCPSWHDAVGGDAAMRSAEIGVAGRSLDVRL